jgi:hypothetical protein
MEEIWQCQRNLLWVYHAAANISAEKVGTNILLTVIRIDQLRPAAGSAIQIAVFVKIILS